MCGRCVLPSLYLRPLEPSGVRVEEGDQTGENGGERAVNGHPSLSFSLSLLSSLYLMSGFFQSMTREDTTEKGVGRDLTCHSFPFLSLSIIDLQEMNEWRKR